MAPSRGRGQVGKGLVGSDHGIERAGVGGDDAIHAPLLDGDFLQDRLGGHGDVVHSVVSRHVRARPRFHAHPEGHGIILAQQPLVEIGRTAHAAVFIAIGQEVLHQGGGQIILGVVTLEPAHERGGEGAVQESIFAVALLRSAPARIAAEVRIGCANHQRRGAAATAARGLVEPARFVAFLGGGFLENLRVPSFAEPDRLNERGGLGGIGTIGFAARQPMQTLDLVVAVDAQPAKRRAGTVTPAEVVVGAQDIDLLLRRQQRQDVGDPFLYREIGILEGILVLVLRGRLGYGGDAHEYAG